MATQGREESERRLKRQGSGIRKEGGDEFKTSPTRGRLKKEILLCKDVWDESEVNIQQDGKRPKQSD